MTLVLVIVLAALAAALFLVRVSRGHAAAIASLEDLSGRTQPVDIEAFRNLLDPSETEFLRRHLPGSVFRQIQRERTFAAIDYVKRIAQNAAVLLRLGQAARTNPDPEVAHTAAAMVERALLVRIIAMRALAKLYLQTVLPGFDYSSIDILDRYRRLTDSTVLLVRLQRPTFAGRVGAML
jgi:hypothetical protein